MAMLKHVKNIRPGFCRPIGSWPNLWFLTNYQMISACSSAVSASQPKVDTNETKKNETSTTSSIAKNNKPKNSMVKLAFKSLNNVSMDDKISKAITMEELLTISQDKNINHQHIEQIIGKVNSWSAENTIQLKLFENDQRFLNLCRKYAQRLQTSDVANKTLNNKYVKKELEKRTSLETIEQLPDVSNINTNQAIVILTGLAVKKKREKPLLQALIACISNNIKSLTFKQHVDVLYCMAVLNFPDDVLVQKISEELVISLHQVHQTPIIRSIITSLGILKYRNDDLINHLSSWAIDHNNIFRAKDLVAFLRTLATIGYKPIKFQPFYEKLVAELKEENMTNASQWLDVVWSLAVLRQITPMHLKSVLNEKFVSTLAVSDEISATKKFKLQNINAAATILTPNYSGPTLPSDSQIFNAPVSKCKEKVAFVRSITDALANLLPSRDYFRTNVDNKNGFILDVEFYFDKSKKPLRIEDAFKSPNALRIGIVANNYHDYCIGQPSPVGPVLLHYELLQAQKYSVLDISHTDFQADDTLLNRITYLNERIQCIVK